MFDLVDVLNIGRPINNARGQQVLLKSRKNGSYLVSFIESELAISLGRLARNAP